MLLDIHRDVSHLPVKELDNNSESVWIKVFTNKFSHYLASWYLKEVRLMSTHNIYFNFIIQ